MTVDEKKDTEKIFSPALLPPMVMVVGLVFFLNHQEKLWLVEQQTSDEPFKNVSWIPPIVFTVLYLFMVFVGRKWMDSRNEFKIKPYIFTYNLYQCLLNVWCVAGACHEVATNPIFTGIWGNYSVKGPASFRISFLIWVHYNNKYVELLDTVWMVLRKKNNQISFLHCYHHVLLIWAWFLVCKIDTGGDCYFGATVNSFIHIIMYGYYTMALLGISCPWKKWITTCQMIQFCVCFTHSCYVVYKGNAPIILPLAQAFVMVNMLVLFGNFFIKSYVKPKGEKAANAVKQE